VIPFESMRCLRNPILASCVCLLLAVPGHAMAAGVAPHSTVDEDTGREKAKRLYTEGATAYRLGNFDLAVDKFEHAYDVSPLPNLLYNIGLANKRYFETSLDPLHLRKAEAVLKNFRVELQKSPGLGSLAEIDRLLAEISADLQAVGEAKDKKLEDERLAEDKRRDEVLARLGGDPGLKMRTVGVVMMPSGGLVVVGGVTLAVLIGLKGKRFESDLNNAYADYDAANCGSNTGTECANIDRRINTARDNGEAANLLAWGLGLPIAIIGAGAITIGAVLVKRASKKTAVWRDARELSIAPLFRGRPGKGALSGFQLSGKF